MSIIALTVQPIKHGKYRFGLNQEGIDIVHPEDLRVEKIYLELQKLYGDKRYFILYNANLTYRNHGNLAYAEISEWISERINRSVLHLGDQLSFDFSVENNGKLHKYVLKEDRDVK